MGPSFRVAACTFSILANHRYYLAISIPCTLSFGHIVREVDHILKSTQRSITSQLRKVIVPLYSALVQHYLKNWVQFGHHGRKGHKTIEEFSKEGYKDGEVSGWEYI